jgi:DNA repair exonuclease SbcCD nuclease subunit
MRAICFTDPHITEKSIPELEQTFTEILRLSKEAQCLICVGDYFDRKNPNAVEIEFGTKWAVKFKKSFNSFIMITGNHPDVDGKLSSVSYLEHLGINVYPELLIEDVFFGHFMLKESICGFNETTSLADLTNRAKLVILGHQHSMQEIKEGNCKAIHPGSCRYVDFGESKDKNKYVILIGDATYLLIRLDKVRPMVEVDSVHKLVNVPRNAMVRVIIRDFNQFLSETDNIKKIEKEFFEFKLKLDFTTTSSSTTPTSTSTTNKKIIDKWVLGIKNVEVKNEIINELKKAGLC